MKARTTVVTASGIDYTLGELNLDQGEEIFSPSVDPNKQMRLAVVAGLTNGGSTEWTAENIGSEMPYALFVKLRDAMLELIKMSASGEAAGEAQAAATA